MYPINFDLWIFHVRGYEGHWALGTLLIGFFYQRYNSLRAGYSSEWFVAAYATSILSGIFFSRLFHFLFWDTNNFFSNPSLFFTSAGGFAVLGGTVGTGLGGYLYCLKEKRDFLRWCDSLMIPILLCLSLSRISCFLNGDAYGIPTNSIFGVVFSEDSVDWTAKWKALHSVYSHSENPLAIISQIFQGQLNLIDIPLPNSLQHLKELGCYELACLTKFYPPTASGDYIKKLIELKLFPFPVIYPPVHPTQLYEAGILGIGYFILLKLHKKDFLRRKNFFFFWIYYSATRYFVELFRGDRNLIFGDLTYAQFICLLIIVFGIIGFFITDEKKLE